MSRKNKAAIEIILQKLDRIQHAILCGETAEAITLAGQAQVMLDDMLEDEKVSEAYDEIMATLTGKIIHRKGE